MKAGVHPGLAAALREALGGLETDLLAFIGDLVRVGSENPPGLQYRRCVERIGAELERLGFDWQTVEAPGFPEHPRPNVLSHFGAGGEAVYFHGHFDVVPAQSPEQFVPRVREGWLTGRGSADMKAGLAAMIYAAYLLKRLQVPLRGRIGLCLVADEETGGGGGSGYLDETGLLGRDGIAMFTPEPTSGVIWNGNRGAITLRITVKGRSAHVGLQHRGVNAFERMLRVAAELRGLKAEVEARTTAYTIRPEEASRSILLLGGEVRGGTNFNLVPETCTFTVDRRINPEEDLATEKDRIFAILERLEREGIPMDVEVVQEGFSSGAPGDGPAARALAESVAIVTGESPAFELCPGLLETRWYARKGIPAFAYGPGLLELAHGPAEAVEVERVTQCALIYALAAARLLS